MSVIEGVAKAKLTKYGLIIGGVVVAASALAGIVIGPIVGYSAYEKDPASSSMVNMSEGYAWEQFIRYVHEAEGTGTIYKDANGVDCYKVEPDGGGGSAVGFGVDIATHGHKFTSLGYSTSIDSLIPVDIVDPVEKEEWEALYDQVNNLASSNGITLTPYQIFALLSRTYNYGFVGGTGQATWMYIYPSTLTFVEAYKQYYTSINNDEYYGDYTKTDLNNQLYTQYMTHLAYKKTGTTPPGWITRRKSEWCLFQTGYYGWGLKNGAHPAGFDEYCALGGGAGLVTYGDYLIVSNAQLIQQTANSNGFDQDTSGYDDACLGFAFAYAGAINNGGDTSRVTGAIPDTVKVNWDSSVYKGKVESSDKQEVVRAIYDELSNGRACVIQVTGGRYSDGRIKSRHYVTAIGYKTGKDRNSIVDTDILIIDTWDSNIKSVVSESATTGRALFNQDAYHGYGEEYLVYTCNSTNNTGLVPGAAGGSSSGGTGGNVGAGGTLTPISESPFVYSYNSTITGKTHYIINQGRVPGWDNYCNRGAGVIIASGYADKNTVLTAAKSDYNIFASGPAASNTFLGKFGLKCTDIGGTSIKNAIDTYTKNGKIVVFRILGTAGGYGECNIDGRNWANYAHWISILDIKVENGEEYVFFGESGHATVTQGKPWVKVSELVKSDYKIQYKFVVSEK